MSKDPKTEIVPIDAPRRAEFENNNPAEPGVGKWYWKAIGHGHEGEQLWCVTELGSNYAAMVSVHGWTDRVHVDHFHETCRYEPDPDAVIDSATLSSQTRVRELMGQVREITARLAITSGPALPAASETQALATVAGNQPVDEYKAALILAKEKTLPDLFTEIKDTNATLGRWMAAKLIPLKAQAEALNGTIGAIKDRIFSVELYAGLVEQITQVTEGAPAGMTDKVHLMQRRAYMDEECLANYQTGGMEFKDIHAFDRWLAKPENMTRVLPFPKTIIAFRVRRRDKERELRNLSDFISFLEVVETDKYTYLYIRNGEQLFRLSTGIEFDAKLFPDMEHHILTSGKKLWAKTYQSGEVQELITEDQYQGMVDEERAEAKDIPKKDRSWARAWERSKDYRPFDDTNVYYDNIAKHIAEKMAEHNRLVLVLQGLLDRSPVLHPHPTWSLWTKDFTQALELIYDESRTLTSGEAPDFEAYRAKLNASLKVGSITVGQEEAWLIHEAEKESARMDRDWRTNGRDWRPRVFRPSGDPGPGVVAKVTKFAPRAGTCTYQWLRTRRQDSWRSDVGDIHTTFTTTMGKVLNIDAYKPGDFHIFFDDPRTRADYLDWAPLLLEAEEFHAGNRKIKPPPPPKPKRESSEDGKERYQRMKKRKALIGKAVRLTRMVKTKGGAEYAIGSLWRVHAGVGRTFNIVGINTDGTRDERDRSVNGVESWSFQVDPLIIFQKPEKKD